MDAPQLTPDLEKSPAKSFEWLLSAIKHDIKSAAEFGYDTSIQYFEQALRSSPTALKEAARETPDQNDKEQFILAMEICQNRHPALLSQFKQRLTSRYSLLANQEDIVLKTELVDESGDLNSRITSQKLIADAQRHFEKGISSSTQGLQNSLNKLEVSNHNNPFGPNVIIEAALQALATEAFSPAATQTLLLHFQQVWFTKLASFYQRINESLRQSGISLSKSAQILDSKTSLKISDSGFKLDTVDTEVYEGTPAFNDNNPVSQDITDAVGLIQHAVIPPSLQQANYKTLANTAPSNSLTLSSHAITTLIGEMQKGYEPNSDGDVIRYIRQQLSLQAKNNQAVIISQADENTINLISLCFRAIATPLPTELAPLILRLKPAYARIALEDGFFFHDNLHPARKLLDQLLSLINSNFNDSVITRYVKTVVMKVQLKFDGDTALFDQLLTDIEGYLEVEEKRFQSNQDALLKQFSAKENKAMAINASNKYLQTQIDHLETQLEYFDFLKHLLSPVLASIYLQHGGKSEQWQAIDQSIRHIFTMLACSDLNTLRTQAKSLANISMQLSQLLTDAKVSITNKQLLLEQLQDIQILQMQGNPLGNIYDSQLRFHEQISDYLLEQQDAENDVFESKFIGHQHSQLKTAQFARLQQAISNDEANTICQDLIIGQWLSILIDQKPRRLQYGFYSRSTKSFALFNSHHEKALERSWQDLQQDLSSGFACLIEQTANFDSALEQVSKSLSLLPR